MDWITAGAIMFIGSVLLYLTLRKNQLKGIPNSASNLIGFFAVPASFFLIIGILEGSQFYLQPYLIIIIFLTALFCAYLGNLLSLRSIKDAPNPGYSLVISKSYVVFTSTVAIVLFGSTLTWLTSLGIIFIVAFSLLIVIDKKKEKKGKSDWLITSIGAFFAWGVLALVGKYITVQGVAPAVYLFYISTFVSVFIFIEMQLSKTKMPANKDLLLLLIMGIFATVFNLFQIIGYQLAPNPGYISAVNAASISVLTILSAYFFKDELTARKLIGVFGVIVGLIMVIL